MCFTQYNVNTTMNVTNFSESQINQWRLMHKHLYSRLHLFKLIKPQNEEKQRETHRQWPIKHIPEKNNILFWILNLCFSEILNTSTWWLFLYKAHLRLSCSICWMELDRVRPCGAGGPVGRCHVVVLFTWSTKKILPWLSIRASQSESESIIDTQ